jgi:4-amino-4-deoxy-L-arabinose transferase-like glycosyltransferase
VSWLGTTLIEFHPEGTHPMEDSANRTRVSADLIVPTRTQPTGGLKHWCWADRISIVLLLILAAQLLLSSSRNSATYDEQYHIAIGLHYLRTGDPNLVPAHPPLVAALATLPVANRNLVPPLTDSASSTVSYLEYSDQLLWRLSPNGPSIVARARLPIIGLTLLLAVTVYAWARELFGPMSGLLALMLLAFDPNILAHGNLATNDMGVTCFATLALYAFWRWMMCPTPARAVIAGLILGLAQVSKFSAVYLIPVVVIILVTDRLWKSTTAASKLSAKATLVHLTVIAVAAYCAIWAIYGFKLGTLKGYPFPAREYLTGLQAATTLIASGKDSFLLGAYSPTGWWYYFPVAFAVKTPLPTLILIGASFVFVYRRGAWHLTLPLLISVVIYLAICVASPFDIGYRHLLPVLPCLFIFTSQLALIDWKTSRQGSMAVAAMLVWLTVASVSIFPHYLTYFNEIAGGPSNGYKILVDSNLDWGQELIGLREYMTEKNLSSVKLSYHGTADPAAYGIQYEPLPSYPYNQWTSDAVPDILLNPPDGVYAISANNLQGLRFKNHDLYATFRQRKADVVVGHSIFIYRINSTGEGNNAPPK